METIYLICCEWTWFDSPELDMNYLYAVKDEITARNDCKRLQIEYNKSNKEIMRNKRYYYDKIDLYTF